MSLRPNPSARGYLSENDHDILAAARGNFIEGIDAALKHDPACVNEQDRSTLETAIHITARSGYYHATMRLLQASGIDLSLRDIGGCDAGQAAAEGGHRGIICEIIWAKHPHLRPEPGPDGKMSYEPPA